MKKENTIALVIGGASGIGKATVNKLLRDNYKVIASDSNKEKLESLKNETPDQLQNRLSIFHLDIADSNKVKEKISWLEKKFSCIDFAVISAGIHSTCPVEFLVDNDINELINVNLIAHIRLVRDLLKIIKEGGRIVGISSIAAGLGVPMSSLYSASKAGLEGFYESLSNEVSYRNVKVILVHPGNVNTGFNETGNLYQATGNQYVDIRYSRVVSKINSRHGINPDIVADTIVKALTKKSPRFCYIVGMNAKKAYWAKRLLGRSIALKLMAKYFGF